MGHRAHRLSGDSCASILHLLKKSWRFGYVSPKKTPKNCPRSSLWKFLGRPDVPAHVVFDLGWQGSLTAWCFPFPLQALPVRPLLPVFLAAIGAEEPRRYALQWQAFQVWLLWPGLCWCYYTQQPHPDTHWGKALQVSTWSQQHLPAVIREGSA